MRKGLLALAATAALLVGMIQAAEPAASKPTTTTGRGECGLPLKRPLWIDFGDGSVPFWEMFAKPGLVSAAANFRYPPMIRARGGNTVYFDLNFHRRLGGPGRPTPTAEVIESANRLYFYAAASTGCTRPWIALNELFGASLPTPWSEANALYRANVLTFMKILADHGAHVFLLLNSKPYTADEAGDWWREAAKYSDFVREVYFPAPMIYRQGPVMGSRTLREAFRRGVLGLTEIGISVSKVGIFLGFQTNRGSGGREGLAKLPWLRTVKWQALAAQQVARELKFATIWSWGWGVWGGGSADPDKPAAACVYLWTRDHKLCNGPKLAGPGFNTSMTEGQINLPSGVQCVIGRTRLPANGISRLSATTKDRQVAFSALFARTVESGYADAPAAEVKALERTVVSSRFGGSYSAYRAALAKAGANASVARGVLADELRQAQIESRIRVASPGASAISTYYDEFGNLSARRVQANKPAWWLGGGRRGIALESVAPDQIFRMRAGNWTTVHTASGTWKVRASGPVAPLASFPLAAASPSIRGALQQSARTNAYQSWTASKQRAALKQTVCRRDGLPAVGAVDLTSYLPFLAV